VFLLLQGRMVRNTPSLSSSSQLMLLKARSLLAGRSVISRRTSQTSGISFFWE
jgi:hypothetical protein